MSEKKELICICCPMGCRLTAEEGPDGLKISGNTCRRGEIYGKQELTAPMRMLTSTVRVTGGSRVTVPVKSQTEIPKGEVLNCMSDIKKASIQAPVTAGQIILEKLGNTDVKLIATDSVPAV